MVSWAGDNITVTDIETAIKRIECGIGYGVMYIAHALVINGAKSIANEWARLSAQAMQEYKMFYPEKIYNILTIFLVLSLLYGIGRLIKDIVEEHKY